MNTLPAYFVPRGISIDRVREAVRRDPLLRSLGSKVGATKVYTDAECEQIAQAVEGRVTKNAPVPANA